MFELWTENSSWLTFSHLTSRMPQGSQILGSTTMSEWLCLPTLRSH